MIDKRIYELLASADRATHYLMETNDILRNNITLLEIQGAITEISVLLETGEGND